MCQRLVPLSLLFLLLSSSTIDDASSLSTSSHRPSGLYVDNGADQTLIHRLTTKSERRALEREILKLLGFPDRPTRSKSPKAPLMKRSAPKYLLNIYENALNTVTKIPSDVSAARRSEFELTSRELSTIHESDVIMTFTAQQSHQGAGGKPDRVKRIWFDVTAVPKDERMTSAELRLYRGHGAKNEKNRGAFTITVYRVSRPRSSAEREMIYVDAVNTTAGQRGWLTLNVTESLRHWTTNESDNKGIYLSVNPVGQAERETRPEDIGIVGFKGDLERQPFMAGFFMSNGLKQTRVTQGRAQGQSSGGSDPEDVDLEERDLGGFGLGARGRDSRSSEAEDVANLFRGHLGAKNASNVMQTCRLRTLYVSFKDLQWQDWIIAPDGYDAFFCSGECKFPMNNRMNATNHAILQTLVHLMQPHEVPKPCCTPTQLSAISVLYFLDENNVVLKRFKDMVVRGCGCH